MAVKIGILVALLYATSTIAYDQVPKFYPKDEDNNVNYEKHIEPANSEEVDFNRHHGQHKPYIPHSSAEAGNWGNHGSHKPHFPHSSQESGGWNHGSSKPHFPHSPQESGGWHHHGFVKPQYPHSSGSGGLQHHGYPKPHFPHNSGNWEHHSFSKPNSPRRSLQQNSGYEFLHSDWNNLNYPHKEQQKVNFEDMERRRPLFYPIHPYHPFYPHTPHAQPSTDDEEFKTVDALRHKLIPFPYFNYFPMEPSFPAVNQISSQIIQEDPNINDDIPLSQEALPRSNSFQDPFIITNKDELQSIIYNILEHFHNSHGKPYDQGELKSSKSQEETDAEDSGLEEIVPLSDNGNMPSMLDEAKVQEAH